MIAYFSNKVRYVLWFFRHNAIARLKTYYNIYKTISLNCTGKEKLYDPLLWYSLYYSGLEPNLQYLRCLPVLSCHSSFWEYVITILWLFVSLSFWYIIKILSVKQNFYIGYFINLQFQICINLFKKLFEHLLYDFISPPRTVPSTAHFLRVIMC